MRPPSGSRALGTSSCRLLLHQDGSVQVQTGETEIGQGPEGELSDLQQAFVEEGAVQCGFCTPGVLMSAAEVLERGKEYTREELSGHLCRCTG